MPQVGFVTVRAYIAPSWYTMVIMLLMAAGGGLILLGLAMRSS